MRITDAWVDRAWRAVADVRRRATGEGSARTALRSLGRPSRGDHELWHRRTSQCHDRYRAEHPPASRRAAVVCVSMRPQLIDRVIANVTRQMAHVAVDLVFVANDAGFVDVDLEARFEPVGGATIIVPEPGTSLGAALNLGLDATSERFVAKMDDDDWYGPGYLLDGLRAHRYAGAGVVGKHTYYAHLEATGERHLRFPGHEFEYTGTLAGGSLLIDRDRVGDLRFADLSLGEDRAFLAACHRRGVSTFSADRFGFVQHRGRGNTWSITDTEFLRGCLRVDPDSSDHQVERPPKDGAAT